MIFENGNTSQLSALDSTAAFENCCVVTGFKTFLERLIEFRTQELFDGNQTWRPTMDYCTRRLANGNALRDGDAKSGDS